MIFYLGRKAIVTLRNGETLRGRIAWSWAFGYHRLKGVELLGDDGEPTEMSGSALIPTTAVAMIQVI